MKIQLILLITKFNLLILASNVPPNIIIFIADDLGWDDVGYHGSSQISTPNIDLLASDGIILDNFYASPVCTPSRGALLSGVHPIHSATQNYVILTPAPWGLPLNIKLLPEYLRKYNYSNHAVGKWHLGYYKKEYTPTFRGFDSHVGFWTGAGDYYDHTALEDKQFWGIDFRDNLKLITNASGIYSTNYFTDRTLQLIDNHNISNPLFLHVAYQSTHGANNYARLQAPQEFIEKFKYIQSIDRRTYAAMAYAMDESIGLIVEKLYDRNMLENTIIFFMSDNGGPASGFTGNAASNWPLRGVKATLWEGGIRVPAFVWSPLLKKSQYISNALMHVTDLLPTLLEAICDDEFGMEKYKSNKIYGMPMWRVLSHDLPSPRNEILHNIDPIWNVSAIRYNNWKLIQGLVFPHWSGWFPPFRDSDNIINKYAHYDRISSNVYSVLLDLGRDPNIEYTKRTIDCGVKPENASTNCKPNIELCLYDIDTDPCEYNNIADKHPEIVNNLWQKILDYNKTAVTPGTVPNDPKADPKLHGYAWSCWGDESTTD